MLQILKTVITSLNSFRLDTIGIFYWFAWFVNLISVQTAAITIFWSVWAASPSFEVDCDAKMFNICSSENDEKLWEQLKRYKAIVLLRFNAGRLKQS